ncbi:MAG: phage tail tape measure protein [Nitrospirae bacterium]|nr:phage tail tape measure protein [Nitrospirota bacterium]
MANENIISLIIQAKDAASAVLENLKNKLTEASKAADGLKKSFSDPSLELKSAFAQLEVPSFAAVNKEIASLNAAFQTLKNSAYVNLDELAIAEENLKKKTQELRNSLAVPIPPLEPEQLKASLSDVPSLLSKLKAEFIGLAAVIYLASKAFAEYAEFSHKMAEVNTLVDISKEKFNLLTNEVINMSTKVPQSAKELAAGLYDLLSAGAAVEQSTKALEAASKAAVAGVTDTRTAIQVGMGIVNAYGEDITGLTKIYDVLFQTVKIGVTTFPELAQHIGTVLPTARAVGVGLTEVSAAIAEMTKAGIRTPQAATALTSALRSLAMPTDEMKDKLKAMGIEWNGLTKTIRQIRAIGLSAQELRSVIPDEEAIKAVLSLGQNFKNLENTLKEIEQSAGSNEEAYKKMLESPTNQIKLMLNSFDALQVSISSTLSPVIISVVQAMKTLMDQFTALPSALQYIAMGIGLVSSGWLMWQTTNIPMVKKLVDSLTASLFANVGAMSKMGVAIAGVAAAAAGWSLGTLISGIKYSTISVGDSLQVMVGKVKQSMLEIKIAQKEAQLSKQPDNKALGYEIEQLKRERDAIYDVNKAMMQGKDVSEEGVRAANAYAAGLRESKIQAAGLSVDIEKLTKALEKQLDALDRGHKSALLNIEVKYSGDTTSAGAEQKANEILAERKRYYDDLIRKTGEYQAAAANLINDELANLRKRTAAENYTTDDIGRAEGRLLQIKVNVAQESLKALTAALQSAIEEEKKYAEAAKATMKEIYDENKSYADKIRDINRKGMADTEQNADKMREAMERFEKAKAYTPKGEILNKEDYDKAVALYKESETALLSMAESAKSAEKEQRDAIQKTNKEREDALKKLATEHITYQEYANRRIEIEAETKKKLDEINNNAKKGGVGLDKEALPKAQEVHAAYMKMLADQKNANQEKAIAEHDNAIALQETIEKTTNSVATLAAQLKNIPAEKMTKILFEASGLDEIENRLKAILANDGKKVTVIVDQKTTTTQEKNKGGLITAFASGGQVPGGYGTRDTVDAKLTPGEFVIPAGIVRKFTPSFFYDLINMRFDASSLSSMFKSISRPNVSIPQIPHYNTGGLVGGIGGMMTLDLKLGDTIIRTYPERKNSSVVKLINKEVERSRKTGYQE